MKNVLFGLRILIALMMLNGGLNKLFQYLPLPEGMPDKAMAFMGAMEATGYMMPLLAIAEIVGGILFALPRFQALGAVILMPITINIAFFHTMLDPSTMALGWVIFLINVAVLFVNRQKLSAAFL
jgi:uncharacterized membrane protein YphA (DoxX/SURF4 family)